MSDAVGRASYTMDVSAACKWWPEIWLEPIHWEDNL